MMTCDNCKTAFNGEECPVCTRPYIRDPRERLIDALETLSDAVYDETGGGDGLGRLSEEDIQRIANVAVHLVGGET